MSQRKLRIAIATLGRFHVLDLARELSKLGHEVRFYSYVPIGRCVKFGLPEGSHVSLLILLWPLVVLRELLKGTYAYNWLDPLIHISANWAVRWRLKPCDVFIGMSGIYLEAAIAAKEKYGARIVLERGSMHIEAQQEILRAIHQKNSLANTVSDWSVIRERQGYKYADSIVVPSMHAEVSFLERGFPVSKLSRIPYGVSLEMFAPHSDWSRESNMILFVGNWCYRKGADLISDAMSSLSLTGVRLVHVGSIGDAPVPLEPWFKSIGHLSQPALREWYCRASVLIMPSREEGLALVQVQALACECPVIGSERSGARDLQLIGGMDDWVDVVECDNVKMLADAIILRLRKKLPSTSNHEIRDALSWGTYGQKYNSLLQSLVCKEANKNLEYIS